MDAAAVEDFGIPREPGLVVAVGGLVLVAAEKRGEAGVHHVVLLQHLGVSNLPTRKVFVEASVQAFLNQDGGYGERPEHRRRIRAAEGT